jgi:3-deoxy-D-manno-octulosonic-acid transferase
MLGQRQGAPCDVLLVDTTGELRSWYEVGDVAFVGKSLPGVVEVGGQNPAEPAALSRPVVFGPHMENFGPVVGRLLAGEGAVQVGDAAGLEEVLGWLLGDAGARERIGARAGRALEPHQGAARRCASLLLGRE